MYNADKEKVSKENLSFFVENTVMMMDTCSILQATVFPFWRNVLPMLKKNAKHIIVPVRCVEELIQLSKGEKGKELADKAVKSLEILSELKKAGYIVIKGEESDNFADNVFLTVFTRYRSRYSLLLITQDKKLAGDIDKLNDCQSVRGKKIYAKQINKYGYLSYFYNKEEDGAQKHPKTEDVFPVCSTVTSVTDVRFPAISIPKEEELVYTSRGYALRLKSKIAEGAEGTVYHTDTPYIAKIYKEESRTRRRWDKLNLMLRKPLHCEGICFPLDVLFTAKKEFVGYIMPEAFGKSLQRSIFLRPSFQKNFPEWKKRDMVELSITILRKIQYLHERNILIGDINGENILVVSPKEVYFVDVDSSQIADYPCPKGSVHFTAPEIQDKHFSEFLRTEENENFAIAVLLFMIMLPGKSPYSQQGGSSPAANIKSMEFPYPFGDKTKGLVPAGSWRFIWSHLPYMVKEVFYHTFQREGKYADPKNRRKTSDWMKLFEKYLKLLESGNYSKQDPMSEEIFPSRLKQCSERAMILKLQDNF